MSGAEKSLVIVYQFGKVASTSLVNRLNACKGVEAHQSHFLGEDALKRIVKLAVDRTTGAYAHAHLAGQLMANVELTYRMNRVMAGEEEGALKVVSLSREPLDWLRSGIQQDIADYGPDLVAFARAEGLTTDGDEGAALRAGLEEVLLRIVSLIEARGMEATLADLLAGRGRELVAGTHPRREMILRRLFFLALRPLVWFDDHFRTCFGLGLEEIPRQGRIWTASRERARFVILRYEDLDEALGEAMAAIGVPLTGALPRDNASRGKPHAAELRAAFETEAAARLRALMLTTPYARHFGYGAEVPLAVAG